MQRYIASVKEIPELQNISATGSPKLEEIVPWRSVSNKRKSSPVKSPTASKKQKLAQCDNSTGVSDNSPTKTIVKILPAKHPQKSTSAQLKRLHESSSSDTSDSDTGKLPAKIQATTVTTKAAVIRTDSSSSGTTDSSDDDKPGIKMMLLPVKANAVPEQKADKVNVISGTSDSDADSERTDDENETKKKKLIKIKPNATASENANFSSPEDSSSEEVVSKRATSQLKTVATKATPKQGTHVSAPKSVTPKITAKLKESSAGSSDSKNATPQTKTVAPTATPKQGTTEPALKSVIPKIAAKWKESSSSSSDSSSEVEVSKKATPQTKTVAAAATPKHVSVPKSVTPKFAGKLKEYSSSCSESSSEEDILKKVTLQPETVAPTETPYQGTPVSAPKSVTSKIAGKQKESSSSSSDSSSEVDVSKKATPQTKTIAPAATPKHVSAPKSVTSKIAGKQKQSSSSSSDSSSEVEVSKKATPQTKTIAPAATPKYVSAPKSVIPKVAAKLNESSSSSDSSSEEEVSKKATPQTKAIAPAATPKHASAPKSVTSKIAGKQKEYSSSSSDSSSEVEVSMKATPQSKTIAPAATPKHVSAPKSVIPKVAAKLNESSSSSDSSSEEEVSKKATPQTNASTPKHVSAPKSVIPNVAAKSKESSSTSSESSSEEVLKKPTLQPKSVAPTATPNQGTTVRAPKSVTSKIAGKHKESSSSSSDSSCEAVFSKIATPQTETVASTAAPEQSTPVSAPKSVTPKIAGKHKEFSSSSSDSSSEEVVLKKTTSQPKTVSPAATPTHVSAPKSVTPKIAAKQKEFSSSSSDSSSGEEVSKKSSPRSKTVAPSATRKQGTPVSASKLVIPKIAAKFRDGQLHQRERFDHRSKDYREPHERFKDLPPGERWQPLDRLPERPHCERRHQDEEVSGTPGRDRNFNKQDGDRHGRQRRDGPEDVRYDCNHGLPTWETVEERHQGPLKRYPLVHDNRPLIPKEDIEMKQAAGGPTMPLPCHGCPHIDDVRLSSPEKMEEHLKKLDEIDKKIESKIKNHLVLLDKDDSLLKASEKYLKQNFNEELAGLKQYRDFLFKNSPAARNHPQFPSSMKRKVLELNSIDITTYHLERTELMEKVKTISEEYRFLLLTSPAASGKTSLLTMMEYSLGIQCIYISCKSSSFSRPKLLLGRGIDAYNKPFNLKKTNNDCIVMLDDAQAIYQDSQFWDELIKIGPKRFPSNIHFIIAATHILSGGRDPSPTAFQSIQKLHRADFLLTEQEAREFLNSTEIGLPSVMQKPNLINLIIQECAGLVGALRISVDGLKMHFAKDLSPPEPDLLSYYLSRECTQLMERCFGMQHSSPIQDNFKLFLTRCFLDNLMQSPVLLDAEDKECLDFLQKCGVLVERNDGTFEFSSLLARRYYSQWLFPNRSLHLPVSLIALVKQVIENMSASLLQQSTRDANDFRKEATFQHLWMQGLAQFTPVTCSVCPELSKVFPFAATSSTSKIDGEIDFYLNGDLRWGIELLVSGNKITKHIDRFGEFGKYLPLSVNDYAIVDFRQNKSGRATKINSHPKLNTVFFKTGDFSMCQCLFGLDKKPVTLTLKP